MSDQETDRPTDHAILSVTTGRIYMHSTAMQPKNSDTHTFKFIKNQRIKQAAVKILLTVNTEANTINSICLYARPHMP